MISPVIVNGSVLLWMIVLSLALCFVMSDGNVLLCFIASCYVSLCLVMSVGWCPVIAAFAGECHKMAAVVNALAECFRMENKDCESKISLCTAYVHVCLKIFAKMSLSLSLKMYVLHLANHQGFLFLVGNACFS